jgi:CO/xanthine dehydrogenase FAD-binding subunit
VAGAAVKPARFEYASPTSLEEALQLVGEDSRPLAGGQSLVPIMNFRFASPQRLGDVLWIGAMTRQATLERSPIVAERWPLLRQAVVHVGHPQIRSRGTVGGSLAHADPKAELPVALAALDARCRVRSAAGERTIAVSDLASGPLMTTLAPDELLVEIEVPAPPPGARTAFVEHARTHGDFALAGVAAVLAPGHAAVALLGAASTPVRAPAIEAALVDGAPVPEPAVADGYRRALLSALIERAIA